MGVGKTTLASNFPKSLILSFEPGSNGLHNKFVAPVKSWSDYKDFVKQLKRTDPKTKKPILLDKYEILVIDTVDEAYKLCEKYVCNEHDAETIKDVGGYGSGYKILDSEFMDSFRELVYYGYGLLFISHETEKPKINDLGQEYTQIVPALSNRPFLLIDKFVDIIGYIREIPEKKNDQKMTFEKALARLEAIVAEMEGGQLSLEKMMEVFEEGSGLVKFCSGQLNEVEKKIETLIKKGDGTDTAPFEGAAGAKS